MAGLGIGIAWFGYAVLYYGVTQVTGDNYGFLDLILPGRWAKAVDTPTDQGIAGAKRAGSGGGLGNIGPVPVYKGTGAASGVEGLSGAGPANSLVGGASNVIGGLVNIGKMFIP